MRTVGKVKELETPKTFKRDVRKRTRELEPAGSDGVMFVFTDGQYVEVIPVPGGVSVRTFDGPMSIEPQVSNAIVVLVPVYG